MRTHMAKSSETPKRQPVSHGLLRRRAFQQRRVLAALRHHGVLGPGLRAAGVSRHTVQRWLDADPSFAARRQEALAGFHEAVKERLLARALAGDASATTLRFVVTHLLPEEFGTPAMRRALLAEKAQRDPWSVWEAELEAQEAAAASAAADQAHLNN